MEPNNPDANYLLGSLAFQTGHLQNAISLISKAISIFPGNPAFYHTLAIALARTGKMEQAIENLNKAISIKPDHFESLNDLGNIHSSQGRLREAVTSYRAALAIKPDFANAHSNLGLTLHAMGMLEQAIESYKEAIRITPDSSQVYNNMGVSQKELLRWDEAIESFEAAVRINPEFYEAHNNLGAAYIHMGREDEALASYRKAIEIQPDFFGAHMNLAEALKRGDKLKEAENAYETALNLRPDHEGTLFGLGDVKRKLGDIEKAIDLYTRADTTQSRAMVLECLFSLNREDDFYDYLEKLDTGDEVNLRVASISAYAAHQFGRPDPYPFCPDPLDYIRVRNLWDLDENIAALREAVLEQLQTIDTRWEPKAKTTKKGFQSGNIFKEPTGALKRLHDLILPQLNKYQSEFSGDECLYISNWPRFLKLGGWFVRLQKGGHQATHTHPLGWLSGVVYLTIPDSLTGDEGAIEFSLHGNDYPVMNEDIPVKRHHPKEMELVLFPSSLHHRTIPFNEDQERICIAFDLMPPD